MSAFDLYLQSSRQQEVVKNVLRFTGEDASGKFGLLANHARMMTCLRFGLAKFTCADQPEEFLALPGGILYFVENRLYITTSHYLRSRDYEKIVAGMESQLAKAADELEKTKHSLQRLDEEMLKRLWQLKKQAQYEL